MNDHDLAINEFLRMFYPTKGKAWCMRALGVKESVIRSRANRMGLRVVGMTDARRLAAEKTSARVKGVKRPEHSAMMKGRPGHPCSESTRGAISERVKRQWKSQPHPRGMLGKHHSPEVRARISAAHLGRPCNRSESGIDAICKANSERMVERLKNHPERVYSRCVRGWREIGGRRFFFRSRWEANYARFLEWQLARGEIESWDYECRTFWFEHIRRGVRSYTPDFLVSVAGRQEWREVKGWMDSKSKTKIARFQRFYPSEALVVVGPQTMKHLARVLGRVIPGWENPTDTTFSPPGL